MKVRFFALSFLVSVFSVCSTTWGQSFRVPEHYSFNTPEDYHKYDKDIIRTINWIEKTFPGEEPEKMKHASRFLLEWLSGCPYVRFTQNVRIDVFMEDSPEYRVYYMGGWTKYALKDNSGHPDKRMCAMAGIKSVLKVYRAAGNRKKDSNIEEVSKIEQQGKLKEWVDERM